MNDKRAWFYDLLFICVLLLAGYLRLTGVNWGEGYHQHPDELFLTGVLDNLRAHACDDPTIPADACPPDQKHWLGITEYFDTATSTLSPYNRGHAFFVYGNLPMTVIRYAMEMTGNDDIGKSKFFARQFSALADLFTIFILYLIVSNLYGRRVGLFAAAFSTLAVMQIQQSHFFTSDLFTNLFMFLALLCAAVIPEVRDPQRNDLNSNPVVRVVRHPAFLLSIGFGVALGMAMASKINAAALAIVLPAAFVVRYFMQKTGQTEMPEKDAFFKFAFIALVVGGLATIISFRIFQPYAFDGLSLNPQWVANIQEQRGQASGEADLPWNLQWARRSHLYSFTNITLWGLGLPLGILAWAGFLLMGWRLVNGEWKHALLWGWTAFYFIWQSLQFNPTMRYQLPIYPLLCMMAAWFLFELSKFSRASVAETRRVDLYGILAATLGVAVLVATTIWAFAFHNIYLREEPRVAATRWIYQNAPAPIDINYEISLGASYNQPLSFPIDLLIQPGTPYSTTFTTVRDGQLSGVTLGHALDSSGAPSTIIVSLYSSAAPDVLLARASKLVDYASKDARGPQVKFTFERPLVVASNQPYILQIETLGRDLKLSGAAIANETDYDWTLPFRIDGYDGFGGMYRGDLVLQVYWDDNADKLARLTSILNDADYIVIPTNHQYAQITRLPERYPLTTVYYRELLGCSPQEEISRCYRNARVGQHQGRLGFDLVAVFDSYPTLGPIVINDQAAEEAFTFYDHPKVFIFKKADNFSSARLLATLSAVDLTNVVHLTPKQMSAYKDLMLPADRLQQQRAGGTWSELFNYDWLQNKYPFIGVLIWYAFIFILGLAAYPIARYALNGFGPYAYPLGRVVGLVLLAWLSWIGGSLGVPFTRTTIAVVFGVIAAAGIGLWMLRKDQFREEWNANRRFFLIVEIVFFAFFLIDLLIRLGNPDLWHPARGGERPMDFSYFNAVLRSGSFPPYDPWFAGGYVNYYYYGFVLAGTPVKLLGIVPSIAYNFILPTWFALAAIGAFAVGFSVVESQQHSRAAQDETDLDVAVISPFDLRLISGLAASVMTMLLGNLGALQLIFNALQRIVAPGGSIPVDTTIVQRYIWAAQGLSKLLVTAVGHIFDQSILSVQLPVNVGEWYWNPSRVIPPGPGNEITEFPLFTFLYSDLHAHMLVIPLTLFIIAWAISFIKSHAIMRPMEWVTTIVVGALIIGALKPTNTWDLYAFFPFAALAVIYAINRHFDWKGRFHLPDWLGRTLFSIALVAGLYALGSLMYAPFNQWYSQAYNKTDWWTASHTPLSSYLTQWGLFLFIITAWLLWEAREWMANTPLSRLKELRAYSLWIEIALATFIALLVLFTYNSVVISWLALPLAALAGVLLFRPDMPEAKRGVLLMIGTGLMLTLVVEVRTLSGDIGRMNTLFKIYMQAWILFSVSAAAAFGWLLPSFTRWTRRWRAVYQVGLYFLLAGAFLFTLTATADKIRDRMTPTAPHTLDSMAYMEYSEHWDGQIMDLSQDYRAIRWMQDHVQGSPVIVEANCTEYRWCTRFTIYTGLPGVVGWNFHQRQQRALIAPHLITDRIDRIGIFYTTTDIEIARSFLKDYDVKYIVAGQLEHNIYLPIEGPPDGFAKFEQYNGKYWKEVYRDKNTVIYEVIE